MFHMILTSSDCLINGVMDALNPVYWIINQDPFSFFDILYFGFYLVSFGGALMFSITRVFFECCVSISCSEKL